MGRSADASELQREGAVARTKLEAVQVVDQLALLVRERPGQATVGTRAQGHGVRDGLLRKLLVTVRLVILLESMQLGLRKRSQRMRRLLALFALMWRISAGSDLE